MQAEPGTAPPPAAAPMAPGMMGGKMGQGGMMGGGMGGMMGGKGMCGMMGGMGGGMMGPGMGTLSPEAQQKFLDATKDLRKKLHDKQFEYGEAARNPKADKKEILKKRKELWDIQQKIHAKAWDFMTE
ncbi:MAG: periplasmic heavy metal sensor [Desulfurivibrionaceae bacterium]